jgi:hypothetical protein
MQIQQIRPTLIQLSIHSFELATLVAAARWIADGCEETLPQTAVDQLRQVLTHYDQAWQQGRSPIPTVTGAPHPGPLPRASEMLPDFLEAGQ